MSKRSAIPKKLRRQVEVESGHRCAIPTCKKYPIDIHHIIPYEECQNHSFDNLIALCTECHARHHRTKEIDQMALQIYKQNLSLLNHRYGEFERRILHLFCESQTADVVRLSGLSEIQVFYLLKDGLLQKNGKDSGVKSSGIPTWEEYQLTAQGKFFIENLRQARALE